MPADGLVLVRGHFIQRQMMKNFYKLLCLLAVVTFSVACSSGSGDDNGGGSYSELSVSTPVVSSVTDNSAVVTATATGSGITSRGVCYSTNANPTINDTKVTGTSAKMTLTLASLQASTTYNILMM